MASHDASAWSGRSQSQRASRSDVLRSNAYDRVALAARSQIPNRFWRSHVADKAIWVEAANSNSRWPTFKMRSTKSTPFYDALRARVPPLFWSVKSIAIKRRDSRRFRSGAYCRNIYQHYASASRCSPTKNIFRGFDFLPVVSQKRAATDSV